MFSKLPPRNALREVHQIEALAKAAGSWHLPAMDGPGRTSGRAGGSILAGCIIAGVVAGIIARQPSIGFLIGTAAGILLAGLLWLRDRRG
jgi:hypothetical protein